MECPKCRYISLPGSHFCEKCGYDLKAFRARRTAGPGPAPVSRGPAPMPSPAPAPTPAGRPIPAPASAHPPAPAYPPAPAARAQAPVIPPLPAPRKAEPPPPPPFARLELMGGEGQVYLLCTDMVRVGRLSPADGILPEIDLTGHDTKGTVSRRHAIITREGDQVYLEDSGSINGTHVNGTRLASGVQRPLQEGDQVCFGEVAFRYHHVKQGAP